MGAGRVGCRAARDPVVVVHPVLEDSLFLWRRSFLWLAGPGAGGRTVVAPVPRAALDSLSAGRPLCPGGAPLGGSAWPVARAARRGGRDEGQSDPPCHPYDSSGEMARGAGLLEAGQVCRLVAQGAAPTRLREPALRAGCRSADGRGPVPPDLPCPSLAGRSRATPPDPGQRVHRAGNLSATGRPAGQAGPGEVAHVAAR